MKRNAKGQFAKSTNLINHIVICLDRSASMGGIRNDAKNAYNAWVERIKSEAAKNKQATTVSLVEFGMGAEVMFAGKCYTQLDKRISFNPNDGSTALFDGINLGIETVAEQPVKATQNESYLLICVTDGLENSSCLRPMAVAKTMQKLQQTDKWTFAFLLPSGAKRNFCDSYGIPEGNVEEWEGTSAGVAQASSSTCSGISSYYQSRSLGKMSMQNFYVQADLSKVNTSQLKNKLEDIRDKCKILNVVKEIDIKSFVEEKTHLPYIKGSAYYQLTKEETIQPNKEIIIIEKNKPAVYGGKKARDILGLPIGNKAKVTPFNLNKYEIFCQSNSVNRVLVRGTKIIIRDC